MRGILLAGGNGTRMFPTSKAVSKQLLPVYDKPAIYYPLSTLMMAGIREVLVISTEKDIPLIQSLLGDGRQWGMELQYVVQRRPEGIAQAYLLGAEFVKGHKSCLILGDNLFYSDSFEQYLSRAKTFSGGATVFAYRVSNPESFGVVEIDESERAVRIEEKPQQYISPWAVTGLYFYDATVGDKAKRLKPSKRGELEITDLNRMYLSEGTLNVIRLGRGVAWLDMGTPENLLASSQFVQTIEQRQGLKIACVEEIAFLNGFIDVGQLHQLIHSYPQCSYRQYLERMVQNPEIHMIRKPGSAVA